MSDTITSNVQTVRAGYEAFGRGDMAALSDLFAPDATWTHRNRGRFSGPKRGFDAITRSSACPRSARCCSSWLPARNGVTSGVLPRVGESLASRPGPSVRV